jgi:hypothetical protein
LIIEILSSRPERKRSGGAVVNAGIGNATRVGNAKESGYSPP